MLRNISQELPPPPAAWSAPRASQLLCGGKVNKSTKAKGMHTCKGAIRLNKRFQRAENPLSWVLGL